MESISLKPKPLSKCPNFMEYFFLLFIVLAFTFQEFISLRFLSLLIVFMESFSSQYLTWSWNSEKSFFEGVLILAFY